MKHVRLVNQLHLPERKERVVITDAAVFYLAEEPRVRLLATVQTRDITAIGRIPNGVGVRLAIEKKHVDLPCPDEETVEVHTGQARTWVVCARAHALLTGWAGAPTWWWGCAETGGHHPRDGAPHPVVAGCNGDAGMWAGQM